MPPRPATRPVPVVDLAAIDCVGYIRVSDESQADEKRTSLDDQRQAIERRASELGRNVQYWFVDAGASGGSEHRPEFQSLLASCHAAPRRSGPGHRAGYVIVLNESRFGRFDDPDDAGYFRGMLRRLGWQLRYSENDVVENKMLNLLLRSVTAAQASEYRDNVKRNARRGAKGTAEQGYWQSQAPYGYRRAVVYPPGRERVLENGVRKAIDERVSLTPHEGEAEIIRAMFRRYAKGADSVHSLADWLTTNDRDRKWNCAMVRYCLKNPAYAGDVVHGRVPSELRVNGHRPTRPADEWWICRDAHPAIIPRDLFDAVQSRLSANRRATRGVRSDWVLTGLVRCRCGATLAGGGGGGRSGRSPSYKCATHGQHAAARCAYRGSVVKYALERAIVMEIAKVLSSRGAKERLAKALDAAMTRERETPGDLLVAVDARLAAVQERRDRLVRAIEAGTLSHLDARARMGELRQEEAQARRDRERLIVEHDRRNKGTDEREQLLSLLLDFPKAAATLEGPALRELLRPWIRSAVFNTDTRVLTMEIRHVPSLAVAAGASFPVADLDRLAPEPKQKGYTVRHAVVGKPRKRGAA